MKVITIMSVTLQYKNVTSFTHGVIVCGSEGLQNLTAL